MEIKRAWPGNSGYTHHTLISPLGMALQSCHSIQESIGESSLRVPLHVAVPASTQMALLSSRQETFSIIFHLPHKMFALVIREKGVSQQQRLNSESFHFWYFQNRDIFPLGTDFTFEVLSSWQWNVYTSWRTAFNSWPIFLFISNLPGVECSSSACRRLKALWFWTMS